MSSRRIDRYVPLAQAFATRSVLFHEAVARRLGLHVTDVKVLRLMGDVPTTPGALARQTGLTGAAITALVDRLVGAGYVARQPHPSDRRRIEVRTVPAQIRRLDRLYRDHAAAMEKVLASYSSAEFEAIVSFLTKTSEVLAEQTQKLSEIPD